MRNHRRPWFRPEDGIEADKLRMNLLDAERRFDQIVAYEFSWLERERRHAVLGRIELLADPDADVAR